MGVAYTDAFPSAVGLDSSILQGAVTARIRGRIASIFRPSAEEHAVGLGSSSGLRAEGEDPGPSAVVSEVTGRFRENGVRASVLRSSLAPLVSAT